MGSKSDMQAAEVVQTVSKSAIEIYNYLSALDTKYELLLNAQQSLENTLEKVKSNENVDAATVEKVETVLASTTAKIAELNDEYKLTDKALQAVEGAVDKAKAQMN